MTAPGRLSLAVTWMQRRHGGVTMEDVFYFTKAEVTLEDIARLAVAAGYTCDLASDSTGPLLHIDIGREWSPIGGGSYPDYWEWREWGIEWWDAIEEEPLERVLAYDPASSFMVTYHPPSLPLLGRFLRTVMQAYGGWAGCDDNWVRVYDVTDVERFQCHPNPP